MVPFITLEEHFMAKAMWDAGESAKYSQQLKFLPKVAEQLHDLDSLRIQEMDAANIALQVVSHAPGGCSLGPTENAGANDQLADAIKRHPGRYAGFATLPMGQPTAAAAELERSVKQLGFVGALIDNHVKGKFYDGKDFWPVFEMAEKLDVPIYLHPNFPDEQLMKHYMGEFPMGAGISMGTSGFGWHSECALHVLRLFAAGVFDAYPKLKIIVGHFGEMLPFMLGRIAQLSVRWGEIKRKFKQVYDENIWITLSGVWSVDPMACILRNTKIERILYSVDYPFADNQWGVEFMKDLQQSGLVSEEQYRKIAFENAEGLLGVKVQ
ncbi:amidohydrolase 2 [Viridothelium virens]|uniref:Amidohydrolase 2 n=1 Tax=Viridothelium virens TaxID=1048519 RepID=A0A6A6HAR8_VIRVR|nr:amidohydrolase 2 [Viridothelium virens]